MIFDGSLCEWRALVTSNADAIRIACELEATAAKLGNVHPGASFNDCRYEDFIAAASKIAPVLASTDTSFHLGKRVLDAVIATKAVTAANVNLGIILLIAPLSMGRSIDEVKRLLDSLTNDDGRNFFEAIRLASPGGMKQDDVSAKEDVRTPITGPIDLVAAMKHAAGRDRIALQYATGFEDFFQVVLPIVKQVMLQPIPATTAVVNAQLQLMANVKDTLIARKCGENIASEAMQRAAICLRDDSDEARVGFDAWLRAEGNRRNPGTTADLIAASLYWLLRPQTNTF